MSVERLNSIAPAYDTVTDEITKLTAEKRAFDDFLSRIQEINLAETPNRTTCTGGDAISVITVSDTSTTDQLRQIRTAYRETVMDVPHYESDYNDSFAANLATEFGRDIAEHVVTASEFSQVTYTALIEASKQAKRERIRVIDVLETERQSLQNIQDQLNDSEQQLIRLETQIDELSSTANTASVDEKLQNLYTRCEDLLDNRQETIQNRSVSGLSSIDDGSLNQYLYREQETICPALAEITHFLQTVEEIRKQCLKL